MDDMIDVRSERRDLRVPLLGHEKAIWADKIAGLDARIRSTVAEAKRVAAGYRQEIDDLKGQSASLAEEIRDGELRPVVVEIVSNYRSGEVTHVRTDTGEVISTRAMTSEERQLHFDQVRRRSEFADTPSAEAVE